MYSPSILSNNGSPLIRSGPVKAHTVRPFSLSPHRHLTMTGGRSLGHEVIITCLCLMVGGSGGVEPWPRRYGTIHWRRMSASIEQRICWRINYLNLHQFWRLVIIGIVDLSIDSYFLNSSFTAESLLLASSIFASLFFLAFFITNRLLSNLASFFFKTR